MAFPVHKRSDPDHPCSIPDFTEQSIPSFLPSFIHSFIRSFIHSFIRSFTDEATGFPLADSPSSTLCCRELLQLSIVSRLNRSFAVVGDIHGNIEDLVRIFTAVGCPPYVKYLFVGDYLDRRKYAIKVLILFYSLKVLFPTSIYLLRGNHEAISMTGA
jgi:hypothetical protein